MKRKTTFLKTLLLAAGLLVGANAWAEKVYNSVWTNDLSTSSGWTIGSNCTANITTNNALVSGDSYLNIKCANGKDADNTFSLTSANSNFASTTDYTFEFDLAIYGSNANNHQAHFYLVGKNSSDESVNVFTIDCTQYNDFKLNAGTAITDQAIDVTSSARGTRDNVGAATVWHHYTVVSNAEDGTSLKVEKWNAGAKSAVVETTKISDDFIRLTQVNMHAGSYMQFSIDNMALAIYTDEVINPSAEITSVNGVNRTVTMTQAQGYDIYYYETGSDYDITGLEATKYTAPLVINENKYFVIFGKNGSNVSDNVNCSFEAGTEIALDEVSWKKTAYSGGSSTVTLTSDATNILCKPTVTIHYELSPSGVSNDVANGSSVSVPDGETFSFYAKATGYANSITSNLTATVPCAEPEVIYETYASSVDKDGVTKGDKVATINTTDYYKMVANTDGLISENLLISNAMPSMMYRTSGIYNQGTANYAINNVSKGDYVTIGFSRGDSDLTSGDGTKDEWNSTSSSYVFKVTATHGHFRFSTARYAYIKSVRVQRAIQTAGATVGSTGYATFAADVALDLSTLTDGFTAYFASSAADGKVTMTKATNEKIAAGEGLFIQGSGAFTITETRAATADVDNLLVAGDGVTDGIVKEDGYDKYVLGASGSSAAFFLIDETPATVAKNKAYLKVPTGGGSAKSLNLVFDDATGIGDAIRLNSNESKTVFNLAGQRIAQPSKGLYIVNGKKVVIK